MGKKVGMRGRPGLFFIVILVIFLAIFFMTWKSMMTPGKNEVKDVYSMNFQAMKHHKKMDENQPRSDVNDIWHRAKLMTREKLDGQGAEKDEDIFKNTLKQNVVAADKKKDAKSPLSVLLHADQPAVVIEKKNAKPYYRKVDDALKIIGGRMSRLVHLDLKGAAPKLSYFKELLPLLSRLGATGLLIEYEDMFPYSGRLQNISAQNAYTKEKIKELLDLANLNSLQVIPLIQTFGHMEFILKSFHLKGLRESEFTPQVIDITSESSYELIKDMTQQILEAHPSTTYLHIGCDEVYELGKGKSADVIIREKQTPEKLFLKHVKRVAKIVADLSKGKVRPIIWDDELRMIPAEDIMAEALPSSVDIMVWRYTQNVSEGLDDALWAKYGKLFKNVWVASSFKGATGSRQMFTEPQHHIINHFSWIDVITKHSHHVNFKGIALTGWQRYDHFATLCELLPVAIPSLAVCLATVTNGGFDEDTHKITSTLLGCSQNIEMGFPELDRKQRKAMVSQDCRFPGHMVYYAVQQLWGYKQFEEKDRRSGWLSDYQLSHKFTSPGQLKVISMKLFSLESNLIHIQGPLEDQLRQIYSSDTVEEWLDENILEMKREMKEIQSKIKSVIQNTNWERRPLPAPGVVVPVKRAAATSEQVNSASADQNEKSNAINVVSQFSRNQVHEHRQRVNQVVANANGLGTGSLKPNTELVQANGGSANVFRSNQVPQNGLGTSGLKPNTGLGQGNGSNAGEFGSNQVPRNGFGTGGLKPNTGLGQASDASANVFGSNQVPRNGFGTGGLKPNTGLGQASDAGANVFGSNQVSHMGIGTGGLKPNTGLGQASDASANVFGSNQMSHMGIGTGGLKPNSANDGNANVFRSSSLFNAGDPKGVFKTDVKRPLQNTGRGRLGKFGGIADSLDDIAKKESNLKGLDRSKHISDTSQMKGSNVEANNKSEITLDGGSNLSKNYLDGHHKQTKIQSNIQKNSVSNLDEKPFDSLKREIPESLLKRNYAKDEPNRKFPKIENKNLPDNDYVKSLRSRFKSLARRDSVTKGSGLGKQTLDGLMGNSEVNNEDAKYLENNFDADDDVEEEKMAMAGKV